MLGQRNDEDMNWLAFQYISGEMSSEEAQAFEQVLDDNVAACEAVSQALTLADAIAVAESQSLQTTVPVKTHVHASGASARKSGWAIVALASCLALLVGVVYVEREEATITQESSSDAVHLVSAWNDSQQAIGEFDQSPEEAQLDSELGYSDSDEEHDALEVPGWLLLAVASDIEMESDGSMDN